MAGSETASQALPRKMIKEAWNGSSCGRNGNHSLKGKEALAQSREQSARCSSLQLTFHLDPLETIPSIEMAWKRLLHSYQQYLHRVILIQFECLILMNISKGFGHPPNSTLAPIC